MIKDDVLVFACVAHPFNFDPSNVLGNAGELFRQHLFAMPLPSPTCSTTASPPGSGAWS